MRPAVAYFEDLALQSAHETPGLTLTEAHVGIYLGLTREPATNPALVPDLLPLCFTPGLGWRAPTPPLAVVAFMGLDWQVLREVRVGDTVHSRARIVTKRPMREAGVIVEEREIIDQRGDVVQRGRFTYLVAKRAKETRA
jgi:acyl dehydratase